MPGQTPSVAVRFEALDALRGVCALLVVLFHIPIYHALKDVAAFANLQFCVDMFFALSGSCSVTPMVSAFPIAQGAYVSPRCGSPGCGRCTSWCCCSSCLNSPNLCSAEPMARWRWT